MERNDETLANSNKGHNYYYFDTEESTTVEVKQNDQ